jgi:hypothetical protein
MTSPASPTDKRTLADRPATTMREAVRSAVATIEQAR